MSMFYDINYSVIYISPTFSKQNTQVLSSASFNNPMNISKIRKSFIL